MADDLLFAWLIIFQFVSDDCYLLTTPGSVRGGNAVLFSPCYTASNMNDPVVLRFYHFTYGQDVGSLLVHVIGSCREASNWLYQDIPIDSYIWEVVGSQNNSWAEVELILNVTMYDSFQVLKTRKRQDSNYRTMYTYIHPLHTSPLSTHKQTQTPSFGFLKVGHLRWRDMVRLGNETNHHISRFMKVKL